LQTFSKLGQDIFRGVARPTEMSNSHTWFNKAVARWLDIALYKAMERIMKAVDLDDMEPVDDFVKHSSSAVDIKTVLVQIKTFWQQLSWPDVEASYAFVSKILDVSKTRLKILPVLTREP
jgi:BAI1-associated protein 3